MIAKHVPMISAQSSDFAELVRYLTAPQGKVERVGLVCVNNCQTENVSAAMIEVRNTQALNKLSAADKTYHLIVSFRPGETPDEAMLRAIEHRLCDALGFKSHQRVSVVHHDTDNLHMHIAINKVHPTQLTIHEPFNAYRTLAQMCERFEDDYGLEKDNHKAKKVRGENQAADMEHIAAVESLLGWIKRECSEKMQGAQSWEAMHQVMREHGLEMHERANGLVITSESGISVKASSVNRDFSKAKLESRLGDFAAAAGESQGSNSGKRYEKRPTRSSVDTAELYARYKADQKLSAMERSTGWSTACARKKRLIEDAKRAGRLKRAAIKLIRAPKIGKKLMYDMASQTLLDDLAAINQQYIKERQQIYERHQRRTWNEWLCCQALAGDSEAISALRTRGSAQGLKGDTVSGAATVTEPAGCPKPDGVTKNGTFIYRFGASAVRDDGDKIKVSRGADLAGLEAAMRMAMARFGSCITVNGSAAFKKQIVHAAVAANLSIRFSDDALEHRRQQLDQSAKQKESRYGKSSSNEAGTARRRPDRSRHGNARQAEAARAAARGAIASTKPIEPCTNGNKSNARSAGKAAPPEARNGLRNLSELGVVHVTYRGEVLLPGHVPGHMEHEGSKPANRVRRDIHRSGRVISDNASVEDSNGEKATADRSLAGKPNIGRIGTAPPPAGKDRLRSLSQLGAIVISRDFGGPLAVPHASAPPAKRDTPETLESLNWVSHSLHQSAADKYIAERESKRANGLAIPKHIRFDFLNKHAARYAGTRQVEGQALALLMLGEEIIVVPVGSTAAARLRRLVAGQKVILTAKGAIKTRGRTR